MRQTRYILLMTLLVAALATQRVVASAGGIGNQGGIRLAVLPDVARLIVKRITREETKSSRPVQLMRFRLLWRRLMLWVRPMVSLAVPPAPRIFALWPTPPPMAV